MSLEDLLRDAYQAKAGQLTEARLDQLTAAREHGLDELLGAGEVSEHTAELPAIQPDARPGRRQHRWIAPALAAAAITAVAVGAAVFATDQPDSRPRPNPPASHVSSPPTSAPTASPTQPPTVAAPPYLPAGQTGSRDQVPWSSVGAGWRLLQKQGFVPEPSYDRSLYLYDPAGGRYLITDTLPSGARLVGWSPDGDRAMVSRYDQGSLTSVYYQLQLRSGVTSRVLRTGPSNFVSYTRPHGLAFVIDAVKTSTVWQLDRYSVKGDLEYSYPSVVNGILVGGGAFYSSDGSELVVANQQDDGAVLIGNDGHFIRTFNPPSGMRNCMPIKLWGTAAMLEHCYRTVNNRVYSALVVQPLSGGVPQVLADTPARNGNGYWDAWQLSNGDVLLNNWADCGSSTYDILDGSTGVIRPLRWPSGIPARSNIVNVSGNIATFEHQTPSGCGQGGAENAQYALYGYNLLTGQTNKLLDGDAGVLGWPGDPQ